MKVKTKPCLRCGVASELNVSDAGYKAWQGGAFVQVAFPELSAPVRELLITGTHPACWDAMFPPDESDADEEY